MGPFKKLLKNFEAQVKGTVGEVVATGLATMVLSEEYLVLHDVVIPAGGGTTQIDQLILSPYGVFVVEVKNYQGWIFGRERDPTWTQRLRGGSYTFQNPLRQNYKHVKALQALTGLPVEKFVSVICFSAETTFKTPLPRNVTRGTRYLDYVREFREPQLTPEELERIRTVLGTERLSSAAHRAYLAERRTREAGPSTMAAAHPTGGPQPDGAVCERCGKVMVLRTAKRGPQTGSQFWGCSGYPACRMIKPLH